MLLREDCSMRKYLVFILFSCLTFVYEARVVPEKEKLKSKDQNGKELIYLQILTSNGHFSPLKLYPNDENTEDDWPNGIGVLTQLGKLQTYEFGKFLRKFYGSFITSNPWEVDAFSSREDRSTVSMLSLMASLYEPTKEFQFFPGLRWQPITMCFLEDDIHDPFFGYPDECASLLEETKHFLLSIPVQKLMEKDKDLYSHWENNSGSPMKNFNDVAELYDIIKKEMEFGLKVPTWAKKHLKDMERISDFAYRSRYNSTESLRLKVGLLLDFLRTRMQVHQMEENPTPDVKVSVYMTHDWNIAATLNAMRSFNGVRPPPCATLVFELYRQPRHHGDDDMYDYSVRTLFFNSSHPELGRQAPNLMTLSGCDGEFCPLSQFVKFFDYVVPSNYTTMCELVDSSSMEYDGDDKSNIYPVYIDVLDKTQTPSPL